MVKGGTWYDKGGNLPRHRNQRLDKIMASFSRLQLAAALIGSINLSYFNQLSDLPILEYDNDPSDPTKPFRSAHESAIFAHLRRIPPLPKQRRKSVDYLSVTIPGEQSVQRHSRAPSSADGLSNPFGRDTIFSEGAAEDDEDDMEVDLSSWGLDSIIPNEKGDSSKNAKKREKVGSLPNPHATTQAPLHRSGRSQSMGNLDTFGAGGAFLDSASTVPPETRRMSLGPAMELGENPSYRSPRPQRPSSTHDLIDRLPAAPPLHSVPFPMQSVRSASPGPMDGFNVPSRERATSSASMGSRDLLTEAEELPNPFAIEPPSARQASRFDPKARARSMSVGTMGSVGSRNVLGEETPSRPLTPSSRLDPTTSARTRTLSSVSMLLDNDGASYMSEARGRRQTVRDRPYSTLELMRPKVLVMPSPLQAQNQNVAPNSMGREGFEITTDGPPLPHGARTDSNRRLTSGALLGNPSGSAVPLASNSFTPNPRASLTLSQLTFRNTLMVGGQRDVAYADIDSGLRRATEEGEQIAGEGIEEAPARPVTVIVEEQEPIARPPGKLYGRSLVDELEHRKVTQRSKQRHVFHYWSF